VTYVITSPCIGTKDKSCVEVCPVDCIHEDGDIDKMLYIDPNECIDCGACEPACPVTAIFAEDDVPAPRTAYAEVTLTVPGKYDRAYVGLYTLIEQVGGAFLKEHFQSGKGLLLKPEGLQGGLAYLGEDWKPYAQRYRQPSQKVIRCP